MKNRDMEGYGFPVLIAVGEMDIPLSKKLAIELYHHLEGSLLEEFKGSGHCANMDTAKEFNKRLLEFLTQKQR